MLKGRRGHAERFRRRLKRTGDKVVRKNLQQGVYGDKDSTDAVLAREFLERRLRDRIVAVWALALAALAFAKIMGWF